MLLITVRSRAMSGEIVHAPSLRALRVRGMLFTAKPHKWAKLSGNLRSALRERGKGALKIFGRQQRPSQERVEIGIQGRNWHTSHKAGRLVRQSEAHWQSFDPPVG